MPCSSTHIPDADCTLVLLSGRVTDEDFEEAYDLIFSDPHTKPGSREIYLVEPDVDFCVTSAGMINIAQRMKDFHESGLKTVKSAVVSHDRLVVSLMAQYYSEIAKLIEGDLEDSRRFNTVQEASKWLGLDVDEVESIRAELIGQATKGLPSLVRT